MGHSLRRDQAISLDQAIQDLQENPHQAARLALQMAAQGNCEAQALLGQALLDGHGIQQDAQLALVWFKIAANRGHAMASNMAGRCLEHGWGCTANLSEAAYFYQQAAQTGLDWGLYNLANLLATGRGVPQNDLKAFELYQRAAERGHAKSMNLVGRYLEEGRAGLPVDETTAYLWYQRSAEAGDFRGQFSLACVLLNHGRWDEARFWLLQALQQGHLKFLRKATDELIAAALPALQDITEAYIQRRQTLEAAFTAPDA